MSQSQTVAPHGGKLVNRVVENGPRTEPSTRIRLTQRQQCDLEMIAIGAMSPLEGFVGKADYHSICQKMCLSDGRLWPVPITCAVDASVAETISAGEQVVLTDDRDRTLGYLTVTETYSHPKAEQAKTVFLTEDTAHPGVKVLMDEGDVCLAGAVDVVTLCHEPEFPQFRLTPAQTRQAFADRGWKTVVAFQTRNPIHRAHEYLTKCALEICDGLLIHPLVGQTQPGDIPADVRMACYNALIEKYYQPKRTMLSVMPAAMRYAGPREAILHAIVRQNFGCSHFIVGRDHAGVGDYYGTYDAQEIFETLDPGDLQIRNLNFEHASWCNKCEGMVSVKTCPHGNEDKVFLSGKKVRAMLTEGQRPPQEFSRPEVADILITSMKR
ncbi:MAG: sulfate adenylyltransferase [Phycisphaerales bacterium]|nr:MAG: sulfate adenylyltransferase [Phycisphaerales bacterium]